MHKLFYFSAPFLALLLSLPAQAEIYKIVDANGRITYSNVKIKGGKKLDIEPAHTNFGGQSKAKPTYKKPAKNEKPKSFPKVDNKTQNKRDAKRHSILRQELAQEKQALERARQAYDEGKNNPEVFRNQNGGISRNVAKFEEKMKNLQAAVDAHERNIELLKKELGL